MPIAWFLGILGNDQLKNTLSCCSAQGSPLDWAVVAQRSKSILGIGSSATETSGSAAAEGIFSGSPDLPLYRSPGGAIIKRLPRCTKVYRDELDKGFAHVRVNLTGKAGWVENAKLIWRLPKAKPWEGSGSRSREPTGCGVARAASGRTDASTIAAGGRVTGVTTAPTPVKTPESPPPAPAAASPSSAPAKPSVAPSIFNPY